jgi:hypothetical protein
MKNNFISKKNTAVFLLVCIVAAFFFSVMYIDLHSSHDSHDCIGHMCSICENLNFACKVLKNIGMSTQSNNFIAHIGIIFLMFGVPFLYSIKKHITLVNLKVRLDS